MRYILSQEHRPQLCYSHQVGMTLLRIRLFCRASPPPDLGRPPGVAAGSVPNGCADIIAGVPKSVVMLDKSRTKRAANQRARIQRP